MKDIASAGTTPTARAQLARALVAVQEEKRIQRMRPAPKPIDVSRERKRQSASRDLAPCYVPLPIGSAPVSTPVPTNPTPTAPEDPPFIGWGSIPSAPR